MKHFRISFFSFALGMFCASVAVKYESAEVYFGAAFIVYLIDMAVDLRHTS